MWRPMTPKDIQQVYQISLLVHSLYEDSEIFEERSSLTKGSYVLDSEKVPTRHPLNTLAKYQTQTYGICYFTRVSWSGHWFIEANVQEKLQPWIS